MKCHHSYKYCISIRLSCSFQIQQPQLATQMHAFAFSIPTIWWCGLKLVSILCVNWQYFQFDCTRHSTNANANFNSTQYRICDEVWNHLAHAQIFPFWNKLKHAIINANSFRIECSILHIILDKHKRRWSLTSYTQSRWVNAYFADCSSFSLATSKANSKTFKIARKCWRTLIHRRLYI